MTDSQGQGFALRPDPGRIRRFRHFLFRVVSKADEDNIFFMAGAITFNVLVALVPLSLLLVGISGLVLNSRFPDPASVLVPFLVGNLPTVGGDVDLSTRVQGAIESLLRDSASFSLVGLLVFVWISTRLVGTLRTVLREIFDFSHGRGIIKGKLFDAMMVVVGGLFFIVNIGITVAVRTVERLGVTMTGWEGPGLDLFREAVALLLAFGSIWVLFFLIYKFLPPRRIPWRTALWAATFTGVLFEVTKYLFSWYVTNAANFSTVYGGLTALAILFFWIYYGAIVFILGGEVSQVLTMSRTRKLHSRSPVPAGNG
jgi:membrane protein